MSSGIAAHETGTNLWCARIHAHTACRGIKRIDEIVPQGFADPFLFAFVMMTTQRAFMASRFFVPILALS